MVIHLIKSLSYTLEERTGFSVSKASYNMLEGTIDGAVLGVATAILGVAGICVGVKLKEKITKSPPSDSLAAIPFLALYAVKMGFEYGSYIGSTYGLAKTVYQIYK